MRRKPEGRQVHRKSPKKKARRAGLRKKKPLFLDSISTIPPFVKLLGASALLSVSIRGLNRLLENAKSGRR